MTRQKNQSKKCSGCNKILDISLFNWKIKRKNKKSSRCRNCVNEYSREHYRNNAETYKLRTKISTERYKKAGRRLVYEFKLSNPCVICGESNPVILEFDHVDPKEKKYDISYMATHGYSIKSIEKEIKKCVILCANCHRKKTAKQRNWHSYKTNKRSK